MHIRDFKHALNNGLVLKNVHRVIEFNQNTWLKPYIDMNKDLRIQQIVMIAKNDFLKKLS